MLVTGCRDIRRQVNDLLAYPTTAEEVAAAAKDYHSDAALVVTKADTQYVLYRRSSAYSNRDGIQRCYAIRYVLTDYPDSWSSRGGEFRLDEPEQPVVLTRTAADALTLTVDSLVIPVTDIALTDSAVTFRFGYGEPDHEATLYLYGEASGPEDPFAETSIQQMLSLSLIMDALMEGWDTALVEAGHSLEAAEQALAGAELQLDAALAVMDSAADNMATEDYYTEYTRIDSIACALGFREKKSVAHGDNRLKYEVSNLKDGRKHCYESMERLAEAAAASHCRRYSVKHTAWHRKCRFTIEW